MCCFLKICVVCGCLFFSCTCKVDCKFNPRLLSSVKGQDNNKSLTVWFQCSQSEDLKMYFSVCSSARSDPTAKGRSTWTARATQRWGDPPGGTPTSPPWPSSSAPSPPKPCSCIQPRKTWYVRSRSSKAEAFFPWRVIGFKMSELRPQTLLRSSPQKDFMSLELSEGKVKVNFDLGSGVGSAVSASRHNDGRWKSLTVSRNKKQGRVAK